MALIIGHFTLFFFSEFGIIIAKITFRARLDTLLELPSISYTAAIWKKFMRVRELLWNQDRIDHIARHNIRPDEVEELFFGKPYVKRAKSQGKNPVYYVYGQTNTGRYLFCVVIQFPDNRGYPVTARSMTDKEKQQYRRWRNR